MGGGNARGANWIGVLILGVLFTFSGMMAFVVSSAMSDSSDPFASSTSDSFETAGRAMAIGMVSLGLVFIALSLYVKNRDDVNAEKERVAEEERRKIFAQNIALAAKAATQVKTRCRYCGALNEEHDEKCGSCGAPL